MEFTFSRVIRAPVEVVFAFFDDPWKTAEFTPHAGRVEVVAELPDGCRTFDVVMRAGAREWMQTIEQVVREPPTRLLTRGGSWTKDRRQWVLTISTDRRFTSEGDGTRIDATMEFRLAHPFRQPFRAVSNWLRRGTARAEFEHQLELMARRIEGAVGPNGPR